MTESNKKQGSRASAQRVIVYVDGFNLYYGLKAKKWRRYYWLDLRDLAERLLRPSQQLARVRYFTSRISATAQNPDRPKRQVTFIEALETRPDLHIHYGHFLSKVRRCFDCGGTWQESEEKMTDVNIAVELLGDAQDDAFDTAIIISGDSDLTGPITAVRKRYPDKRVIVAFPPKRHSVTLAAAATASFTIGRKRLQDSQFPETVTKADGFVLRRPIGWS